jgi:hypothetical protein
LRSVVVVRRAASLRSITTHFGEMVDVFAEAEDIEANLVG